MNKIIHEYFKKLSRKGGSSKSLKKVEAARRNGKKGGRPKKENSMRTLQALIIIFIVALTSGCHTRGLDRLTGGSGSNDTASTDLQSSALTTVSCCGDIDSFGNFSYPSFLPAEHVSFCQQVETANVTSSRINGVMYIGMGVDCGHGHHDIGDEYYPSTGY